MKHALLLLFVAASLAGFAQKQAPLHLRNALIVAQMNSQEDRFTVEVLISELFSSVKIPNAVSLNMVKNGGDPQVLLTDSLQKMLAAKGINTMMLVSVRGYDRKFQPSTQKLTQVEDLASENLFSIYKEDVSSVTLEFHFYRDGQLVYRDLIRVSGISSRDGMIKKFRKKLRKKLFKDWR